MNSALAYHRQHAVPVVIARFFNVVGPRQTGTYGMVLPRFVESAVRSEPLVVHDDGQQQRCFAHVHDVVSAIRQLMQVPQAIGGIYNVGTDTPISIGELAARVLARARSGSSLVYQPYAEAYTRTFRTCDVASPT